MISSIIFVLAALLMLNGLMFVRQPTMTFFPHARIEATPEEWGFEFDDVQLVTDDNVRLHGWYVPHPDSRKAVLFLHGNGGNISHRGDSIGIFHRLGLNVFIIDYRGYGRSEGRPSEQGIYLDALAAWRFLTEDCGFAPEDILVFGRSLGGAVAADLAAKNKPGALVLESTFSSARDMARELFPVLSRLVWLRYEFNTLAKLEQVTSPVMVLHSPQDEIIPMALGERVFQSANEPKQFMQLQGGHNGGFLQERLKYEQQLGAFIDTHL